MPLSFPGKPPILPAAHFVQTPLSVLRWSMHVTSPQERHEPAAGLPQTWQSASTVMDIVGESESREIILALATL